jgi:acid phosphatase type 7
MNGVVVGVCCGLAALAFAPTGLAAAPVIVAAGDIACATTDPNYHGGNGDSSHCAQARTADVIARIGPDAVLPLGDLQYEATSSQYRASYDPSWGRFKAISRPVVGNHEYAARGARGYFDYFGSRAGPRGKGWYSWNIGSWHLIALNSQCDRIPGGCARGSEQERWLRRDLAAHQNFCTLAYWHEPRFSSGPAAPRNSEAIAHLWNALHEKHVDVALTAHKHFYERLRPLGRNGQTEPNRGIRQFIVGTGGKDRAGTPGTRTRGSQVLQARTFGVLKLTLRAGSYTWRFEPEAGRSFTDSGTGTCR